MQVGRFQQALIKPLGRYRRKLLHYAGALKPLAGVLAPGALPFWLHAHRVPELHDDGDCTATRYALPLDFKANTIDGYGIEFGA